MARIVLEQVSKAYTPGTLAVDSLSLDIADGEFMVFVGPSGCGKSTALRCIAGLEEITGGTIRIGDKVVNNLPPRDRDIAMVFQNYALYPHMTVRENLAFGLQLRKVPKDEQEKRVQRAARMLGIETFLDRKPAALSGGQRQRVAMGRAIVREPQAFLMDEPLSNLDAKLRVAMRASLNQLHRTLTVTTIYVTHDQIEAMTLGDRVAVLRDGRLQQADTPQTLFEHPVNLFVAGFIGSPAMNLVEAEFVRDNGVWVAFGGHRLPVPDTTLARRTGLDRYLGRRVVVGVRPSSFEDATLEPELPTIEASIGVTEELGSEINLLFTVDAPSAGHGEAANAAEREEQLEEQEAGFTAGPGQSLWTARVSPKSSARPGSVMKLAVDVEQLHFFDPETGLTIGDDLALRGAGSHVVGAAEAPGAPAPVG